MPMTSPAAPVVVGASPLAVVKRLQRELVRGIAQVCVAGKAEDHDDLLAASICDRDDAGVALEMAERLPAPAASPSSA